MSAKVIPLRKPAAANSEPWVPGEICQRRGVDYALVTAGEIRSVEWKRTRKGVGKADKNLLDLLRDGGAQAGDYVLVLRRTTRVAERRSR